MFGYLCIIFSFFCALNAHADLLSQKNTELHDVNEKITQLQTKLTSTQTTRKQRIHELKETEADIKKLSDTLNTIHQHILQTQQALIPLEEQKQAFEKTKKEQQVLLADQLRANYQMGSNTEYLQLLLNEEDPSQLARLWAYYHYLHQARIKTIADLENTKQKITDNEIKIRDKLNTLKLLYKKDAEEKKSIQTHQNRKHTLVALLDQDILSKTIQLKSYQKNQKALETLIKHLKHVTKATPFTPKISPSTHTQQSNTPNHISQPSVSFQHMMHHLPWPVSGTVVNKDDGLMIFANEGTPVIAVYPGKVVFSHWLKGFGFLVILDNGQGFMTLYANNQSLTCHKGQIVRAGQTIATVGHTGSLRQSGLYFEIRHQGQTVAPKTWLQ